MPNREKVLHTSTVKESLGKETIEVLISIFDHSKGSPPSVPAKRFRADNPNWIGLIDKLSYDSGLIECGRNGGDTCRVSCYALPLIDSPKANRLLDVMAKVFLILKKHYQKDLNTPLSVAYLLPELNEDTDLVIAALAYMKDISGWWSGLGRDFPEDVNATMQVSEEVLLKDGFFELISRFYEWHYVNPQKQVSVFHLPETASGEKSSSAFFPTDNQSAIPDWYEGLDNVKKALIQEIDMSIANKLTALPTMGLRTLIESIMMDFVGDSRGFAGKLKRFEVEGFITGKHAAMIDKVLDAGNAAAHRAYFPNEEDLLTCVNVVRHLMEGLYILHPKLKKVAENTPPRPKA